MFIDLTQYLWILWLALVFLFVVIELLTFEFTFLMVAAGSLIGGLGGNLLGLPWWAQIGGAAILSALLLFTIRPVLLKTLRKGADLTPSNVDALYGMGGRAVIDFDQDGGSAKLDNGETWTARAVPGFSRIKEGDLVVVTRILGSIAEVAPATADADEATDERKSDA